MSVYDTTTSCSRRLALVIEVVCASWLFMPGVVLANDEAASSFFPLEVRWLTDLGAAPEAPPAYTDDAAFAALRDGTLVSVRLSDGEVRWSTPVPTLLSPVAGPEIAVAAVGSVLFGLQTTDGAEIWRRDMEEHVTAPLVLSYGWLVVGLQNGDIAVLRGEDGAQFWRRSLGDRLIHRPSIAGSRVFVPVADGRVVALELTTGRTLWETRLGGRPQSVLPLDDVFVGANDNFMYRLAKADGKPVWRWRTGADIIGIPAVTAERVFFVSLDNVLRALDRGSGVQQWRRPLPGRATGGPQIIDDMVLVSGVAPRVLAFDALDGTPRGTLTAPGELAGPPFILRPPHALAPGLLLMTGDGRLAALGAPLGPPTFSLVFPPPPLLAGPSLRPPSEVLPFEPLEPLTTVPTGAPENEDVPLDPPPAVAEPPDTLAPL